VQHPILLAAFLVASTGVCEAKDLVCTDRGNAHLWVKRLSIDVQAKTVTLSVLNESTPRVARLTNASEVQFGKPVFAFNLPPAQDAEPVTNVFKLFHTGSEWRLVDAGLLAVNGTLTLRALGQSVVFVCRGAA
jgi:hypothetical protein